MLACKWKLSLADKLEQVSRECGVQEEGFSKLIVYRQEASAWSDLSTGVICSDLFVNVKSLAAEF